MAVDEEAVLLTTSVIFGQPTCLNIQGRHQGGAAATLSDLKSGRNDLFHLPEPVVYDISV